MIKWYLSQSACGIKCGINTAFLARNSGSERRRQTIVAPEFVPRVGFDEYMPARQLTLAQVGLGGILEFERRLNR